MKNPLPIVLVIYLLAACQPKIERSDIAKLNGYWEIEKVIMPDGTPKEYSFNDTFDYFEISNNKGFRKKLMPQLDGTFLANDLIENFSVVFDDGKTYLKYVTQYAGWSEELKLLSAEKMVLVNAEQKEYHYKKTAAINLTGNGKKSE